MVRRIYHSNQKQPTVTRHGLIILAMSRLKTMLGIESLGSGSYLSGGGTAGPTLGRTLNVQAVNRGSETIPRYNSNSIERVK